MSVNMIKSLNNILQQVLKKMRELEKKWKNALFLAAPQVNSQIMEHLGYSFIKIITRI